MEGFKVSDDQVRSKFSFILHFAAKYYIYNFEWI